MISLSPKFLTATMLIRYVMSWWILFCSSNSCVIVAPMALLASMLVQSVRRTKSYELESGIERSSERLNKWTLG